MNQIKIGFCQKVIPLTYDESLSYYEVLCKLTNKMNEVISYLDEDLTETSYKLVNEFLKSQYANCLYTKDTENLTLAFDTIVTDANHTYDVANETMTISDKASDSE